MPPADRTLTIDYVPLDDIVPARRNPKRHDLETIRASILRHGLGDAAGIRDDRTGRLVAGHGRLTVLADLRTERRKAPAGVKLDDDGTWLVPILSGVRWRNEAEAEAFLIGHNRTVELGGWDATERDAILAEHRDRLQGTGYTIGDLAAPDSTDDPDPLPPTPKGKPITKAGDIWQVGPHTLICGSCRDLDVEDLVLAHVRQWGYHLADEYCWERSGVPKAPTRRLKNGHEPVYQFARGEWKWRPQHVKHPTDSAVIPIGEGAGDTGWADRQGDGTNLFAANKAAAARKRAPSNADRQGTVGDEWFADRNEPGLAYPSNRLPTFAGSHEATGHPAAFPIGLPEFFVRLLTDPGDAVLDPFAGSGSTIIAAHNNDRIGLGIELSPGYMDLALARIQHHTGLVPHRDGEPHDLLKHTGWSPARDKAKP